MTTSSTLPSGWRQVTLGDFIAMNDSTYLPKEAWTHINYLDTGNITENRIDEVQSLVPGVDKIPSRARRKVKPGDILYSTVRPNQRHYGHLRAVPDNLLVSTGFAVLRGVDNAIDTGYIYWFLIQDEVVDYLHAIAETSTSTYPSIKPSDLERLTIPLPPLEEQQAIAHILGTLDDKIELNRRMNETLEGMAQALFKSWFVDFEPVRAKMEGRWHRGESLPGLPAEHYDLFPDRLVDSELGEIPEGWEVKPLGEVAEVVYGAPFASANFNEAGKGLPLIRIRDLATHSPTTFTDEQHPNGTLIRPGDIVVGMDGEFRAHIWKGPEAWLNQRVCHFRPHSGVPSAFLFEALIGPLAYLERAKTGTTVIHLGKTDIDSIMLLSAPSELLNLFGSLAAPMVHEIVTNAAEIRALAEQRDALLPRLMSGEVRVSEEQVWK